ncbi:uncharacterized protein N7498_005007 [Penicillium cinerascens]|uniref:Yeast cell wall synthesis Kre9/Knh1-like N-terminal domain-containing protein n=1 Tax=Penicillium cinerascens TaxID=70096 RepID=A0A9W9MML5_9EURO|nr:uncharacterized protein N7498_005007 [Penicillium cinerascens]KAJ5204128.1 hypothetical protein N7498_005007 [Penicillium cinerascens]
MRAFICLAVSALAAVVAANSTANPFQNPPGGYTFTVGQATTLVWRPTTPGTVSLRLQHGELTTSTDGTAIASGIPNDGSYTWTVPSDVSSEAYTIEIISDEDADDYNFLPRFVIAGATAAATTSSAAPTTTSATPTTTSVSTTSTPSTSSTSSTSSSASSTSSSAATTMTTMTTTTSSSSAVSTSTGSTSTSKSSSTASASSSQASVPSTNAGLVNRVSGGMLALVAGAIAFL